METKQMVTMTEIISTLRGVLAAVECSPGRERATKEQSDAIVNFEVDLEQAIQSAEKFAALGRKDGDDQ